MYQGYFFKILSLCFVFYISPSAASSHGTFPPICKINIPCLCSANRYSMEVVIKAGWKENVLHIGKGGIDPHSHS